MPAALRHAVRLAVVFGLAVSVAWPSAAQAPTAKDLYETARSREAAARAALASADAPRASALRQVRRAMAAYREVVRSYPRSGYCDDALWKAAGLAADAFARFDEEQDRATSRALLVQLVREYPTSRFVPLARGALERADAPPPATPPPVVEPVTPPAPPERTAPAPVNPGPPAAAPSQTAPADLPLWSLPIEQTLVVGLPALASPGVAAPAVRLPMGRTLAPVESSYAAFVPRTATGQQPAFAVALASQFTTGDEMRTGGQPAIEPDLGVQLFRPGLAIGNLYADVNVTQRDHHTRLGRGVVRLDGFRLGGLTWSVDAGDTWNAPVVQDFGFTNLFAPPVTFEGLSASGSSPRTFFLVSGGRVTAQRNIFGTDSDPIGQRLYQGLFSHRASDRVDIFGHANYIDSRGMTLYTPLTDWSTDGGGGVRYRPTTTLEVVADAGVSQFRRHGAPDSEVTPSGLLGALWSFTRGWAQVNAQRYPIGRFPVYNYPYIDRAGVFASGEVDLGSRARVFAGAEYAISNLDREASTQATAGVSPGDGTRGFGGVRLSLFDTSMVTLRVDGGGRRIEPSHFGTGFDNNTGVIAIDWHSRFPRGTAFARYERRTNTDPASDASSFTQDDLMGQVYLGFAGGRQIFGKLLLSRRIDRTGDGQTQWQVGGGGQAAFGRLYARVEATAGRTLNWLTQIDMPRQAIAAGLSGQIARATYLSVDCYLDHSPVLTGSGNPWVTRTMVRLTRTFPLGPSRLAQPGGPVSRGGPSGRIAGEVFVDWNDNGELDPGEEAVGGVTIAIAGVASFVTGADGRFVASGVPVGEQRVALRLDSVPANYDPPAVSDHVVTVTRNQASSVAFAMLPLGSFGGMVYQDVDGDGQLGPADTPIDGAVLVMDDGSRTEITRNGAFAFDPVRMGKHTVNLLLASLPEGSQMTGPATAEVELSRGEHPKPVVFLVKVEKRPEIRKVFPAKKK